LTFHFWCSVSLDTLYIEEHLVITFVSFYTIQYGMLDYLQLT